MDFSKGGLMLTFPLRVQGCHIFSDRFDAAEKQLWGQQVALGEDDLMLNGSLEEKAEQAFVFRAKTTGGVHEDTAPCKHGPGRQEEPSRFQPATNLSLWCDCMTIPRKIDEGDQRRLLAELVPLEKRKEKKRRRKIVKVNKASTGS